MKDKNLELTNEINILQAKYDDLEQSKEILESKNHNLSLKLQ